MSKESVLFLAAGFIINMFFVIAIVYLEIKGVQINQPSMVVPAWFVFTLAPLGSVAMNYSESRFILRRIWADGYSKMYSLCIVYGRFLSFWVIWALIIILGQSDMDKPCRLTIFFSTLIPLVIFQAVISKIIKNRWID